MCGSLSYPYIYIYICIMVLYYILYNHIKSLYIYIHIYMYIYIYISIRCMDASFVFAQTARRRNLTRPPTIFIVSCRIKLYFQKRKPLFICKHIYRDVICMCLSSICLVACKYMLVMLLRGPLLTGSLNKEIYIYIYIYIYIICIYTCR